MKKESSKDLSKDSTKGHTGITKRIQEAIRRYPNSKAKALCQFLKIDYSKYKQMIWTETHRIKKYRSTEVLGRPLDPQSHRVEYSVIIDSDSLELLSKETKKHRNAKGVWYRSGNRNRALVYSDSFVSINVFHKSRSCRILMGKPMPENHFKVHVVDAFFNGGLDLLTCEDLARRMEIRSKHRTFLVGDVSPFKIDYYKSSLGLQILSDKSHPQYIEAIENCPSWVRLLINSNLEYAKQMNLHLDVLRGIGEQTAGLEKEVKKFSECIDRLIDYLDKRIKL